MSRDKQFGPVLMFGLGGIFVEIDLNPTFAYKDGAVAVDARMVVEDE